MSTYARGATATLDSIYQDSTGTLVDPTSPTVSIIDPYGTTVVSNAVPTHVSTGRYQYAYPIAADAALGSWIAHWTGTINGGPVQADDVFSVVGIEAVGPPSDGRSTSTTCEAWPFELCEAIPTGAAAISGTAWQAASDILWGLSGRQFGICTVANLRPCRRTCDDVWRYPMWDGSWTYPQPALLRGQWFNLTCGTCAGECSCHMVSEFVLPHPIHAITEIIIDGTPLATGSYRVDDQRLVVRTDGGLWPLCNDLNVTSGPGAWSVTAQFGVTPPALAALAVGELMLELIRACMGDTACRLPKQYLSSLQRQGVSLDFISPAELLKDGLLNLYFCDLFIRTFNPHNLAMAPTIYSPDARPVRQAGT